MALVVKVHLPMREGRLPGSRAPRTPGGERGSPLQYSSLGKSPMDRGAWPATVHKVTKSQTLLK